MKKSFKVLEDIEEKKIKVAHNSIDVLPVFKNDFGTFKHFPPKAFEKLLNYPEYGYLKDGLYVSERKLRNEPKVIKKLAEYNKHMASEFKSQKNFPFVYNINWYEAKKITQHFDAKMLTAAEFHCIREWTDEKYDPNFYKDLCAYQCEWLDTIVDRVNDEVITHNTVDEALKISGIHIPYVGLGKDGFCNLNNTGSRTGMPLDYVKKGDYYHTDRPENSVPLIRTWVHRHLDDDSTKTKMMPHLKGFSPHTIKFNNGNTDSVYTFMRMCYKVDDVKNGGAL